MTTSFRMSGRLIRAALTALALAASGAALADGAVICNSGLTIASGDVKDVYTGEKQMAGSTRIVPVDNSAAQADFLSKVLKMEAGKYQTAWTKKSFRDGLSAPAVKSSDAEVIEFVKKTPGAVGYVSSGTPAGVTVVERF